MVVVQQTFSLMKRSRSSDVNSKRPPPVVDDFFHRHAAALNNVGATLVQRGDSVTAMHVLQRSVQTLMQAEAKVDLKTSSKEKQDEMELFLESMLLKTQEGHDTEEQSQTAQVNPQESARATVNPNLSAKAIPGIFRPATKFKVARRPEDAILLSLSFSDPFFIKMSGKAESCPGLKKRRADVALSDDLCGEVFMEQTSEASLFNMGLVHIQWGCFDSAIQLFQLAISVSTPKGNTTPKLLNPIVLAALSNIGQICCQLGRTEEAIRFYADAMARGNAALALLRDREEAEQQEAEQQEAAGKPSSVDASLASLHRILARILMNLGCAKFTACAYGEAQRACEDALRLLHDQLTDLDKAAIWFNLAMVQEYQQNRIQAIEYYDMFLEAASTLVGPDHPNVADALFREGCAYYDIGQLHKALPPLLKALTIRLRINGDHHCSVAEVYHHIGKVLQAREEYEDALSSLTKALNIQRELFQQGNDGEIWLQLAETLLNVGRLYHAQGKIFESLQTYREVVSISVGIFGEHHPQIARMHVIVANLELELGHVSQSLSNFTEAARIELDQGRPVESTSKVQNRLARVALLFHPAAAAA
jgi:tetratricopeptide (TPR) repeat protein